MARRIRHGLDYFPLDTSWDLSMRLLKEYYGLEGIGVVVQLFQMIYKEGYFILWNAETKQLFCSENRIEEPRLNSILEFCLSHSLFDQGLFDTNSVLTSSSIQRQWVRICTDAKRKSIIIEPALNLCTEYEETQRNSMESPGKLREYSGNTRELSEERKEENIKKEKSGKEENATQLPPGSHDTQDLIDELAKVKRPELDALSNDKEPLSQRFMKIIKKAS